MRAKLGWGPLRWDWYSVCSGHRDPVDDCPRCAHGHWVHAWAQVLSAAVYDRDPELWRWWANRPSARRSLGLLLKSIRGGP